MSENYQPPFTMTEEITNLIVEIGEYVGTIITYDAMRRIQFSAGKIGLRRYTPLWL